ncbi:hypothetical protein Micbo1qcDRAFT_203920 [Microdochium bolleyi]|uniref:ATP-dependent RNA helicase DHX8 n=1 Tax=Microdochium bolleyi TaxID=196109 RepID=A0A136J3W9_9PEZI|nr:hypothetical protein Micbo1qcDRAFT_203920 [Microdochium bolleyi]
MPPTTTPFRQIRAKCDRTPATTTLTSPVATSINTHDREDDLITVYQAYNAAIATAACAAQRLDASPRFKLTRMTWVKPSWCWMMYRAGYSHKDANQERILALRMRRADLWALLRMAELTTRAPSPTITSDAAKVAGGASARNGKAGHRDGNDPAKDGDIVKDRAGESHASGVKSDKVKVQWDPERDAHIEKLAYRSIQIGIPAALAARWIAEWIVDITDVTDTARELKMTLDEEPTIADGELVERGLCPVEEEIVVPADLREILRMDLPDTA